MVRQYRPPAGSLYARQAYREAVSQPQIPHMFLEDGSFLLGAPAPVENPPPSEPSLTPLSNSVPLFIPPVTAAPQPSDVPPGNLPLVSTLPGTAAPFLVSPPPSSVPLQPIIFSTPSPPSTAVVPTSYTIVVQTTRPTQSLNTLGSTSAPIQTPPTRFSTITLRSSTISPSPRPLVRSTSTDGVTATPTAFSTIPSPVVFTPYTTFPSTTAPSTTSLTASSSSTATTSSASSSPTSTAANSSSHGLHSAWWYIGISIGSLLGFILILGLVLLYCQRLGRRRWAQQGDHSFFGAGSEEKNAISRENSGAPAAAGSMTRDSSSRHSSRGGSFAGRPQPPLLLADEFEPDYLQLPQPLVIANHVHGDLSSDERSPRESPPGMAPADHRASTLRPPSSWQLGNDMECGTPRTPQPAPFLRGSLRDGGLPVPWLTEATPSAQTQQLLPFEPRDRNQLELPVEVSRRSSRASHVSSAADSILGGPSIDPPAEGWAATLRSNLYATIGTWTGTRNALSDPELDVIPDVSREPSRTSRHSRQTGGAGASSLYRSESEASQYSQQSALPNPFSDQEQEQIPAPVPASVARPPNSTGMGAVGLGLGLGSNGGQLRPPSRAAFPASLTPRSRRVSVQRLDSRVSQRSISGISGTEEWPVWVADAELGRFLSPNASRKLATTSGRRSSVARPSFLRRASTHDGGYTSAEE